MVPFDEFLPVLGLLLALWLAWRLLASQRMRIVHVIDGDTLVAADRSGKTHRLRLYGVDCPETGQRLADEATRFVRAFCQGQWVSVRFHGRDRYDRRLASVRKGGKCLETALAAAGLAYAIKGAGPGVRLAQARARLLGRGVWGLLFRKKPWDGRQGVVARMRRWSRRQRRRSRR